MFSCVCVLFPFALPVIFKFDQMALYPKLCPYLKLRSFDCLAAVLSIHNSLVLDAHCASWPSVCCQRCHNVT